MLEQGEVDDGVSYTDIHSAHRGCNVISDVDVVVDRRDDSTDAIFNGPCTDVIVLASYGR